LPADTDSATSALVPSITNTSAEDASLPTATSGFAAVELYTHRMRPLEPLIAMTVSPYAGVDDTKYTEPSCDAVCQ
jgi:hypothetical protein